MNKTMWEKALDRLHAKCKAAAEKAERDYDKYKGGEVKAATDGDTQTVELRGVFDGGWWGVDANAVIAKLSDKAKTIHIIIDSPGGFVDEGRSLYSELRSRSDNGQNIVTEGRALVASAAVLPLLAGDDRSLEQSTLVMVHNPFGWMFSIGDAEQIRADAEKTANMLEKYTTSYIDVVAERTGLTKKSATEAMKAETWYDADEAIDKGFVSAIASTPDAVVEDAVATTRANIATRILQGYNQ